MRRWRYSRKEYENMVNDYEQELDIQRRDIEFLKKDNDALRNSLFEMSCNMDNNREH